VPDYKKNDKELHDCVKGIQTSLNTDKRVSMTAYREVLEKLKDHHHNLGTLASREALEERRHTCFSRSPPKQTPTS